jgi:hypothetical protein
MNKTGSKPRNHPLITFIPIDLPFNFPPSLLQSAVHWPTLHIQRTFLKLTPRPSQIALPIPTYLYSFRCHTSYDFPCPYSNNNIYRLPQPSHSESSSSSNKMIPTRTTPLISKCQMAQAQNKPKDPALPYLLLNMFTPYLCPYDNLELYQCFDH